MVSLQCIYFCTQGVSIFDVSHMLQLHIHGKDRVKFIESILGNYFSLIVCVIAKFFGKIWNFSAGNLVIKGIQN